MELKPCECRDEEAYSPRQWHLHAQDCVWRLVLRRQEDSLELYSRINKLI